MNRKVEVKVEEDTKKRGDTGVTDVQVSCKVGTNKVFLKVQFHIFVSTLLIAANWSEHIGVEQDKRVMKQIGIRLTGLS